MRYPSFVGGSFGTLAHRTVATERTINWYPAILGNPGVKAPIILEPTPGTLLFATAGTNPGRALFQDPATLRGFTVMGDQFFEVFADGTLVSRMSAIAALALDVGTDPACIVSNGDGGQQLFLTSGGHGYCFDLVTNALVEVLPTVDMPVNAFMCAMLDTYVIVLDPDTSSFFLSNPLDALTFDPLNFQQRSKAPDRWISLAVAGGDVWLLGTETSEISFNAGTTPFPFALRSDGVIPFGTAAPFSAQAVGGTLFWLARTAHGLAGVVSSSGSQPSIISDLALTRAFEAYQEAGFALHDAVGTTYEKDGHAFYQLTLPDAHATWCYDLTTQRWHERGHWNALTASYEAWRPLYHATLFGKHLMADRTTGQIHEIRNDYGTDVDGAVIRRMRRAPILSDENRRLFFGRFELDLENANGTSTGDGAHPAVMLNYSNDAGRTWRAAGQRRAGAIGETLTRVFWTRLGSARNRVFEIVVSDPVPWRITDAYLN